MGATFPLMIISQRSASITAASPGSPGESRLARSMLIACDYFTFNNAGQFTITFNGCGLSDGVLIRKR